MQNFNVIMAGILFLVVFYGSGINPAFSQNTGLSRERKHQIDSLKKLQWALWKKEEAAREIEREEWIKTRTVREKDPFYKKLMKEKELEDSLRRVGYDQMLKTLPPAIHHVKLTTGKYEQIPEIIYSFRDLDTLNLRDNQIGKVPKRLSMKLNLKSIIFARNQLSNGKIRFARSESIVCLDLSENQFKKIPCSVRKLKNLRSLKINGNQLSTKWKMGIFHWDSLKSLDLSHNQLRRIPGKIHRLKNLEYLNLSYNQIRTLKGLNKLDQIEELEISFNPIFLDPRYIVSLPNLKRLIIRNCGLIYLPPEISRFKYLTKLVIPENKLTDVPPEIGSFDRLENLMLYKNQLKDLPDELYNLSNLIWLDVYYNDLTSLSPRISRLENLEILYVSYNKLQWIPESIGEMINLRELYLHHNQLRNIPSTIGNLKNLKYLHLYENHLTDFPESLLRLDNLVELNLSRNLISVFPSQIATYEHLKYIYLEDNNTEKGSSEYEEFKWALKQLQDKGVRIKFDY